jgi:GDP-4-dehydro-6-deoxy-D-mannose reductase
MAAMGKNEGRRALITGADGFVGRHLARYLLDRGVEVLGLGLHPPREPEPWNACSYEVCDVVDRDRVFSLVRDFRPGYVFHLAAQSSVRRSWEDPLLTYRVALLGQSNVFHALVEAGVEPVVHVACSAEEYGPVSEEELPIPEDRPLRPVNPYALSKVIQEEHALFFHRVHGTRVVITRAFNIIGPGQTREFVASDFAHQIAEIEAGLREPVIRVGNLEARRDFSDVRDLVEAFWALVNRSGPGEVYNVCSGEDRPVREVLELLVSMSRVPVRVEVDPGKLRKTDIPALRGDNRKLRELTGWEPSIPLEKSLRDLLEWCREEVCGLRETGCGS